MTQEQRVAICLRADRITKRLMPCTPAPHGFQNPAGFVAATRYSHMRTLFYKAMYARIAAKVAA
jgi:hypothetical protein